jgi:two-component system LytT family sensor kinase
MGQVKTPRTWAWVLGVWTVIALLMTRLHLRWYEWIGEPTTVTSAAISSFGDAYLWALVTTAAIWTTRRYRLGGKRWKRSIAVHVAVALVVPVVRHLLSLAILAAVGAPSRGYLEDGEFETTLGPYLVIFGVVQAFDYARLRRERAYAAERLQAELVTARLHRLKAQLHPHFLFNTMHAVSSLMHTDVAAADRMLSQLAGLLRRSLRDFDVQKVPLREELDFLLPYLDIERARLRERLRVELDVDHRLDLVLLPHLLLQPLVENAVRHGIAPRPRGGCVELRVARQHDRLVIHVADDGPGASEAQLKAAQGVGLANTRARLDALYGDEHRMEIDSGSQGFTVRVELPLEFAPEATPVAALERAGVA